MGWYKATFINHQFIEVDIWIDTIGVHVQEPECKYA